MMDPADRHRASRRRRAVALLATWALLAVVLPTTSPRSPVGAQSKPNIIVINLDDADFSLIDDPALDAYFPNIATHLRDEGMRLRNLHVTTPLCGPSRASLLRGQLAHNTGVQVNVPKAPLTGGFSQTYESGHTYDELGTWLHDAGYTTMLVGKYLHSEFPNASGDHRFEPPNWDEFHATLGGNYYEFTRLVNGTRLPPTPPYPESFRTDVEAETARQLIADNASDEDPFFLYVAPFAPHLSPTQMYAPRHAGLHAQEQIPRTPDFNEADFSDKPQHLQVLEPMPLGLQQHFDSIYRDRLRSMQAVDDMVGTLFDELGAADELDDTFVLLTSDNGFSLGHNRLFAKHLGYDRMTRVGALVRGPGIPAGVEVDHLLGHIDIAPTLVDLAGGAVPDWLDGGSFTDVLFDPAGTPVTSVRTALIIENWKEKNQRGQIFDGEYTAVRTAEAIYVHWENGEREYYDLASDPYQLENAYDDLGPGLQAWGAALAEAWAGCEGPTCRQQPTINQPPDITVSSPTSGDAPGGQTSVQGVATDDGGVAGVEIVVRPRDEDRYWNGTAFVPEYHVLTATLDDPGATATSFDAALSLPDRDIDLFVRARDLDDTTQPDALLVRLDANPDVTPPETTLGQPQPGAVVSGQLKVAGSATDDIGVADVLVVIRQQGGGLFWNGSGFQSDFVRVPAQLASPGTPATSYQYVTSVPAGDYSINTRAFDLQGNFDPSAAVTNASVTG